MAKKDTGEAASASVTVSVRITSDQREQLKRKAERVGIETATYLKRLVLLDLEGVGEDEPPRKAEETSVAASKSSPPAVLPRELTAVRTSIDGLRSEIGRVDEVVREIRGAAVQNSLDSLRNELGRTDGVVRELRSDVATAIRLILLAQNPPGSGGTKLSEEQIDELIESVFPPS